MVVLDRILFVRCSLFGLILYGLASFMCKSIGGVKGSGTISLVRYMLGIEETRC